MFLESSLWNADRLPSAITVGRSKAIEVPIPLKPTSGDPGLMVILRDDHPSGVDLINCVNPVDEEEELFDNLMDDDVHTSSLVNNLIACSASEPIQN